MAKMPSKPLPNSTSPQHHSPGNDNTTTTTNSTPNLPSLPLPTWWPSASLHTHLSTPSGLYPLKGLLYFSTHRFLWPLLRARLVPALLLSIFIYTLLFTFTYLPQVLFLALFHWDGLAWFNGAILVLGEGAAITALLFEAFMVDSSQVDVFDAVLVNEGCAGLVAEGRVVLPPLLGVDEATTVVAGGGGGGEDGRHGGGDDPVKRLGEHRIKGAVYAPFSLRQIVEFVVLLPLNLIPWMGVPVFLVLTGYRAGPFHHHRYYQLLGVSKHEKKDMIRRRQLRYTWFGSVALMLQLVPGLSMVFLLTTAAGAALWVRDLERSNISEHYDENRPREEYTDDPV